MVWCRGSFFDTHNFFPISVSLGVTWRKGRIDSLSHTVQVRGVWSPLVDRVVYCARFPGSDNVIMKMTIQVDEQSHFFYSPRCYNSTSQQLETTMDG